MKEGGILGMEGTSVRNQPKTLNVFAVSQHRAVVRK